MDEANERARAGEEGPGLEPAVVWVVIGVFALIAFGYDMVALKACYEVGGLVGAGRALAAMGLGWMCGWYFTVRFPPTSFVLRSGFFQLAGHFIAMICSVMAWGWIALMDSLGAANGRASFTSILFVTFAPVASWFATQLSRDRAVHFVAGVGIGVLSYVVFVGMPD